MSFTSESTGGTYKNTHNHYQTNGQSDNVVYVSKYSNVPRSRVKNIARGVIPSNYVSNATGTTREDSTYNETIDIIQPYITVYLWRRTA